MKESPAASSLQKRVARRVGLWTSVGIGGTGLGLALVREIVDSHGGRDAVTEEIPFEKEGSPERAEEGIVR